MTLSFPTDDTAMQLLVNHAIARDLTDKSHNQLLVYDGYLPFLNEGAEAP